MVLNGESDSDQPNHASMDWQLVMWRQKLAIYLSPHQPVIVSSQKRQTDRDLFPLFSSISCLPQPEVYSFTSGSVGSQTTKHILVHFKLKSRPMAHPHSAAKKIIIMLWRLECRINCLKMSYAKHSASTAIRPIDIKCEMILKTV